MLTTTASHQLHMLVAAKPRWTRRASALAAALSACATAASFAAPASLAAPASFAAPAPAADGGFVGDEVLVRFDAGGGERSVELPAGVGVREAVGALESNPSVRYAAPNHIAHISSAASTSGTVNASASGTVNAAASGT